MPPHFETPFVTTLSEYRMGEPAHPGSKRWEDSPPLQSLQKPCDLKLQMLDCSLRLGGVMLAAEYYLVELDVSSVPSEETCFHHLKNKDFFVKKVIHRTSVSSRKPHLFGNKVLFRKTLVCRKSNLFVANILVRHSSNAQKD